MDRWVLFLINNLFEQLSAFRLKSADLVFQLIVQKRASCSPSTQTLIDVVLKSYKQEFAILMMQFDELLQVARLFGVGYAIELSAEDVQRVQWCGTELDPAGEIEQFNEERSVVLRMQQ